MNSLNIGEKQADRPRPNGGRSRFLNFGQVAAAAFVAGCIGMSFVFGAAVMFFGLPSSDFLKKAFAGSEAMFARADTPPPALPAAAIAVAVDKPDKTYDGFTLYTSNASSSATLLDMSGKIVHKWQMPFRQAWPAPLHISFPMPDESIHWFRCHLYPNGDLLAIYHADNDTPYGYGLVKLDKDSNLLWRYAANVHHDIDLDEEGRIYTLVQHIERTSPAGVEPIPTPFIADNLVVLSPDGKLLESIPLVEAFRDSPYALALTAAPKPSVTEATQPISVAFRPEAGDVLHANSVKVLSHSLAAKFPLFKAGQVLISLRTPSTIAVVDLPTRSVVWAADGMWHDQHDPEFLPNGHLLIYDNSGSPRGIRILEYDPQTQAYPWWYADHISKERGPTPRGMKQRLLNGNTLIVYPADDEILEVAPSKEVVWRCDFQSALPGQRQPNSSPLFLTGARRYAPDELTFLKGESHARP